MAEVEQGTTQQQAPPELSPPGLCDVCGQEVAEADAYRAELAVGDMMCPAPMLFHKACYEQASDMWKPDPDSYCTVDPEFPETGQWTNPGGATG